MRKSFIGLSALVRNELDGDPLSGHVFGFCNKRGNLMKLLVFDGSGYWVMAKRLQAGTFAWPRVGAGSHEFTSEQLSLLLAGIDVKEATQRNWYRLPMSS